MSDASTLFLGIIAVSVLLMAVLQLGAVIALARYAKRIAGITDDLQREIKPLVARVNAIAEEAHRATSLAGRQVERVDELVTDLNRRIADTSAAVQASITGPLRNGTALVAGFKAVLAAFAATRRERSYDRDDDDDALFVG